VTNAPRTKNIQQRWRRPGAGVSLETDMAAYSPAAC
jgi:hypothetical protein